MLDATRAARPADFTLGERAKQRSVHNSYMTFPLLFIMLSNHFPATYANPANWLVLLLLCVAGAAGRHAMIGRGPSSRWALVPAALALAGAMFLSVPKGAAAPPEIGADALPSFAAVRSVINQRCQPCHSQYQTDRTFGPAPGGVTFDTPESIARLAERIRLRVVETQTMPFANKTGMTDQERGLLWTWLRCGESASRHIAVFFLPWIIDPGQTHPWVGDRLGLSDYPIIYRELSAKCLPMKPLVPTPALQAITP